MDGEAAQLVLTFDDLLRRTPLPTRMRAILHTLEENYHSPVDMEFTAELIQPGSPTPGCGHHPAAVPPAEPPAGADRGAACPANLAPEDVIFSTRFMVPRGHVPRYPLRGLRAAGRLFRPADR